jgi:2,4-dienoyl-CoA reductase-like NADH-dependent reductase (Old Yellow Enzyme family)
MDQVRKHRAFPVLFSTARVGAVQLRNRVVCAPQLTGLAEDGLVTEELVEYYAEKARGGAGFVVFESTPVHPSGAGFVHCVRPYEPAGREGLPRVAVAVQSEGARVVAQLWHCGRQGSSAVTGRPLLAPSSIACPVHREVPDALTPTRIAELVGAFAAAARVFQEAGFDGVELAAGHGYLIHQFLSPLSNVRNDRYGGSPEHRARFLLDLLEAIRGRCDSGLVLGVRLSGDEFLPGGFGVDETLRLVRHLREGGPVDYLSVSAGTHASVEQMVGDWSVPRGNLVSLAAAIRSVAGGIPVIACGRIVEPEQAEAILEHGDADLIGMARALIADPHWPAKAREGRPVTIRPCISCNECESRLFRSLPIACAVNPALAETDDAIPRARRPKRVVVVGGGVAGMEAARVAAIRGYDVVLYEQTPALGGQIRLVEALGTRPGFERIVSYLEHELGRLDVDVRVGHRVEAEPLIAEAPDAVVVATGAASAASPPVDGPYPRVRTIVPEDLATGTQRLGARVMLVDRGVSHDRLLTVAEALLAEGREVHVVTARPSFGSELSFISLVGILARLHTGGAVLHCSTEIVGRSGETADETGLLDVELATVTVGQRTRLHGFDTLVMFAPPSPRTDLLDELQGTITHLLAAGDCLAPRDLERAFSEGRAAGLTI